MADNSYSGIFKSTFLFGFVQIFKAVISIVKNKLVAILIGADGMGLLGIYNSTLQLIQTGAGLGINQSAVRDVAEANGSGDTNKVSRIITVTNRVLLITGTIGCLITLILSHWLSVWTLGGIGYTLIYCILSIVVALNIINEGKQALLKGVRNLRALANASIIGATIGLFTAIPLYYFFGKSGIVPELIISSSLALLVSQFYVYKMAYKNVELPLREILIESKPMIRIGVALMFITFLQTIVALVINSYIRSHGGLRDVGYFSAGTTLLSSYFGVIITALMTDYYPRISAINNNNAKLQEELNNQSQVSLIVCCPMIVVFIVYLPFIIELLYTPDFLAATEYIIYAIYGTLITICSNQVDLILISKGNVKFFTTIAVVIRVFQLLMSIILYSFFGLKGLGISALILGVIHLIIMTTVVYKLYKIIFNKLVLMIAFIVLILTISASLLSQIEQNIIRYLLGLILSTISILFSFYVSKKYLNLDFLSIAKRKIVNKH